MPGAERRVTYGKFTVDHHHTRPATREPSPNILLRLENRELARSVARCVRGVGGHVVDDLNVEGGTARLALVIVDRQHFDRALPEIREIGLKRGRALPVLLLSEHDGDPLSLPLTDGSLLNVIARVSKNGELNISDVSVTVKKLLGSDIFGVEKYVRWGSTISNFQIGTSNDLPTVQRHLEELLTDLKVENRKMNEILTIAEELILNALLNAPVDAQGNRIYANKPREEEVALPPEHASLLSFAADGDRVAIACRDPFGSLDPDNLLRSLRRCADIESNGVRTDGQGGAGIGLFIVYRFADHMVVNLSPGHATEFIAVVDLSLKGRDRSETARSLNMFISSEGHGPLVA